MSETNQGQSPGLPESPSATGAGGPASAPPDSRYPFTPYPNGWFRAAYSRELLPGQVRILKFFGREWVLYRSESGEARLIDPYCVHLGAHLGHGGEVIGENIRCPFHHWEFAADGRCAKIPYAKRIPSRARLSHHEVAEKNGLIFSTTIVMEGGRGSRFPISPRSAIRIGPNPKSCIGKSVPLGST